MKSILSITALLCLSIFIGCSSVKTDPNTEVQDFLNEFAASLSQPDSIILKKFNTSQSEGALLAGIRVLQNDGTEPVKCTALFSNALITFENSGVKVNVPITLEVSSLPDRTINDSLVLWLTKKDAAFVISKFEGEGFYNNYITLSNSAEFELNQTAVLASREYYYTKAIELQKTYDSVIWYANYQNKDYFYVVKGTWINYFADYQYENKKPAFNYSMGLVDADGRVVVPLEFELVGTLGMAQEDVVEVKKGGKTGYYQISTGKSIVPSEYEWIIPRTAESKFLLVKKDSASGWLDESYSFHAGFPDAKAKKYVKNFEFLPQNLSIDETSQSMAEIPNAEYAAYGIIIPPSYLTSFGLFDEILGGFSIGEIQNRGYREYVKTKSDFMENVTGAISAVFTTITERYLEGREEFYTHREVTFVNAKRENIGAADIAKGETTFKKIDSTLFEVKVMSSDGDGEYYEPVEGEDYDMPTFIYFRIDNLGKVARVSSDRSYVFTEVVKMDSSYLTGKFRRYDQQQQDFVQTDFLSPGTIMSMRNEILASYGYIFSDQAVMETFSYRKWYQPRFHVYGEFADKMTPVDKYNLAFLERIVGTFDPAYTASL